MVQMKVDSEQKTQNGVKVSVNPQGCCNLFRQSVMEETEQQQSVNAAHRLTAELYIVAPTNGSNARAGGRQCARSGLRSNEEWS